MPFRTSIILKAPPVTLIFQQPPYKGAPFPPDATMSVWISKVLNQYISFIDFVSFDKSSMLCFVLESYLFSNNLITIFKYKG